MEVSLVPFRIVLIIARLKYCYYQFILCKYLNEDVRYLQTISTTLIQVLYAV
jgi:hypothetical protein